VSGSYEHCNVPSGFIKCRNILEWLGVCKLFKHILSLNVPSFLQTYSLFYISFRFALIGTLFSFFRYLSALLSSVHFLYFIFPFNRNFSSVLFLSIPLLTRSVPCNVSYLTVMRHSDAIVTINNGLETPLRM
jgi:hypothetical protein